MCWQLLLSLRERSWLSHKSLSRPCLRQVLLPRGLAGIVLPLFSGIALAFFGAFSQFHNSGVSLGFINVLRENSTCNHFMPFSDNWEAFLIPLSYSLNPVIVLPVYFHNLPSLPVAHGFLSSSL